MASKELIDIDKVWEKGKPIRERNPDAFRRDAEGNVIRKGSYGTQGEYGWEIDHKIPVSKGGKTTCATFSRCTRRKIERSRTRSENSYSP